MSRSFYARLPYLAAGLLAAWAAVRYALPVALPFLLGAALALGAEPLVKPLRKFLPGGLASFCGVSLLLVLVLAALAALLTLLFRQLGKLVQALPNLEQAAAGGLSVCRITLSDLAARTPTSVQPVLQKGVDALFQNGNALVDKAVAQIPSMASALFSKLTGSALALGTGVLGGYFLSARLPKLRAWAKGDSVRPKVEKALSTAKKLRDTAGRWLKAQLKLCAVSFLLLLAGLFLLRIPRAFLWAFLIALVDAVPLLGTGTVLIPWAAVCFLQGNTVTAVGLLGLFTVTALTRSTLEPRLVGKQLGLDPLMTLIALYAGYRFWGFGGMILSPLLCVIAKEAFVPDAGL